MACHVNNRYTVYRIRIRTAVMTNIQQSLNDSKIIGLPHFDSMCKTGLPIITSTIQFISTTNNAKHNRKSSVHNIIKRTNNFQPMIR